jgi:hypothetical protein
VEQIGQIIKHDFTGDWDKKSIFAKKDGLSANVNEEYWKEKYIALMEKYLALLESIGE